MTPLCPLCAPLCPSEGDLVNGEIDVAFRAVFYNGERGNITEFIKVTQDDFNVIGEIIQGEHLDEASISASGISSTVYAPIMGSFKIFGSSDKSNATSQEWSFWQHKSGLHKKGGGIGSPGGADDTNAWDISLNLWYISSSATDLDQNMDFFPVASGMVVKWYADDNNLNNDISPSSKNGNAILIKHTNSDGSYWWSGYLHASTLYVKVGDSVTVRTKIGKIEKTGATDNNHLHLAVYTGENKKDLSGNSLLESTDISFAGTSLSISSTSSIAVKKGKRQKISATAIGTRDSTTFNYDLNSSTYYKNYWWISSNRSIAKVDGYGNVTGISSGVANITVYFSGEKATTNVTVTE